MKKFIISNNKVVILLLVLGVIGIGYKSNQRYFFPKVHFSPDFIFEHSIPQTSDPTTFSSVWNTSLISSGSSGTDEVMLPLISTGLYNFMCDWGDGTPIIHYVGYSVSVHTHTYTTPGIYTINLTGVIEGWRFNDGGDRLKLLDIEQWGNLKVGNKGGYFYGCENLQITATDTPNLHITNLDSAFRNCNSLGTTGDFNSWDLTTITSMSYMFHGSETFNQSLNEWNVSRVTDMNHMFHNAANFNGDISSWDVSSVVDMTYLFYDAKSFNSNISSWDVSSVNRMWFMFFGASSFDQPLTSWDVSSVQDMSYMFSGASLFNQYLDNWDVSSVTSMSSMFCNASSFNQPLNSWDVSSVTSMASMFYNVSSFNQPLNSWDVSNVQYMMHMFSGASSFNQLLDSWEVSSVTQMYNMFYNASSFNQPIDTWDVSNVEAMNRMFEFVTLDSEYYDNLLIAWAQLPLQTAVTFHAGFSQYTKAGDSARSLLKNTYSWIITDGEYHPHPFPSVLSSDADEPDRDGSVTLSWTDSYATSNYTVYQYPSPITEINGSLTILAEETTNLNLSVNHLFTGTYYFAVSSNNWFLKTLSNCIRVEVLIINSEIEVNSPTATSQWELDTEQTMLWGSEGDIANVKIELYRGEAFVTEIISSTANDGEYIWLVPTSLSYAENYRIKIIDVLNPGTYDFSDNFEVGSSPVEPKKIPGYNLPILIGLFGCIGVMLVLKIKKFMK